MIGWASRIEATVPGLWARWTRPGLSTSARIVNVSSDLGSATLMSRCEAFGGFNNAGVPVD